MVNILVECPSLIASVRVGVLQPLQPLQENGQCEIRYRNTIDIKRQDIRWCDILIIVRGSERMTLKAAEAAKAAGKFLIYYLDDDLLNIPDGISSTPYYRDPEVKGNIVKILSLCNVLWAVNRRILEKYSQWCSRTVLSRVPAKLLKDAKHVVQDKLHILYAGSVDHNGLVQEKLSPAVRRILQRYSDKVDFTFIGADPKLRGIDGVKCYSYFDSYDAYQKVLLDGKFDIGLAPGSRSPFFSCKYFNKFIEYSTYGIAGIYENCPPFTDIVKDGENGMLCGEESEDWYAALCSVIEGKRNIAQMVGNAQKLLLRDFTHDEIVRNLTADIPELVSYASRAVALREIHYLPMKWIYLEERLELYWRRYGILAVFAIPCKAVRKLWRYLRQKASV